MVEFHPKYKKMQSFAYCSCGVRHTNALTTKNAHSFPLFLSLSFLSLSLSFSRHILSFFLIYMKSNKFDLKDKREVTAFEGFHMAKALHVPFAETRFLLFFLLYRSIIQFSHTFLALFCLP
jgi:hypothetical protein